MASTQEALRRRRACNAVSLWSRTVRTLRQHGGVERLRDDAVGHCTRELAAVLAAGDLGITLVGGEVRCEGQAVLRYGCHDVPFGLLADAGVGEVVIDRGTGTDELERLLRACADAPGTPDPDYDLARALRAADLPGLSMRAPTSAPADRPAETRVDWWLLPEPVASPDLVRCVEREGEARLPARVLTLLLADIESGESEAPPASVLAGLLDAMLAQGDPAGAARLLEQTDHRSEISAATALRLRRRALATYDGDWLAAQLRQQHDLQGLVALAMQLGNESFDRLANSARETGMPLPDWVASMLTPER